MGDTAEKIPLNTGGAKPTYSGNDHVERVGADALRLAGSSSQNAWTSRLDGRALVVGLSSVIADTSLHPSTYSTSNPSSVKVLPLEDVVGCEVSGSRLVVHSYPKAVGCCASGGGAGGRRYHVETHFEGSADTLAFFHHEIMFAIRCGQVGSRGLTFPPRTVLVLVNPCSGAGLAPALFKDEVEPVLRHAQIDYQLHVTTCQGDGEELVQRVKLTSWSDVANNNLQRGGDAGEAPSTQAAGTSEAFSEAETKASAGDVDVDGAEGPSVNASAKAEERAFDTILIVSGDGLLYEAVQGIMARPDWRQAIRVSLCIAPGGSGNGLSKSVLHHCGEAYGGRETAFVCARGVPMPFDLSSTFSGPGMSNHTCGSSS